MQFLRSMAPKLKLEIFIRRQTFVGTRDYVQWQGNNNMRVNLNERTHGFRSETPPRTNDESGWWGQRACRIHRIQFQLQF